MTLSCVEIRLLHTCLLNALSLGWMPMEKRDTVALMCSKDTCRILALPLEKYLHKYVKADKRQAEYSRGNVEDAQSDLKTLH